MSEADLLKSKSDASPNDVAAGELAADALFEDDRFQEAKSIAERTLKNHGISDSSRRDLQRLIRKCDTHLPSASPSATAAPTDMAAAERAEQPQAPAAQDKLNIATSAPPPAKPAAPSIRNEWFQTPSSVTFTYYVKGRDKEPNSVNVTSTERALEVCIKKEDGAEFQQSWDPLFAAVDSSRTQTVVKSMKVEVTLHKRQPMQWPALEAPHCESADAAAKPDAAAVYPSSQAQLQYPNSRGTDWNKVKLEDEEEEGKPTGDAALNKLFKDIYAKGSDEQRRAMMKSFQESNGTVLSTNWEDVGAREVKGEAPKGMEMKQYEQ